MNTLKLTDYEKITGEEDISFCKALQNSLRRDMSGVVLSDWTADSDDDSEEDLTDREKGSVTVFHTYSGGYWTYKYAGMLRYQNRTVQITSRFDDNNQFLSYTLKKAGELPVTIMEDMTLSAGMGQYRKLLAQLFLKQLKEAYELGVYRQYRTFEHNDSRPRGHLDISRHIRLNPLKNGRVAYSTREYTSDNPVNRLILAAWCCLRTDSDTAKTVENLLEYDATLRKAPDELQRELGEVRLNFAGQQKLLHAVSRPITHPMHQRYEQVRRTAILILRKMGHELFEGDSQTVSGYLFPMDRIWELFLENTILPQPLWCAQNEIQILLPNLSVEDGKQRWDKSGKRELKPDFLLDYNKETHSARVVLDAKYKKAWAQSVYQSNGKGGAWSSYIRDDVFQVLAYMLVTGAEIGGILFPIKDETAESWKDNPELPRKYMAQIREKQVFRLHSGDENRRVYTIPIRLPSGGTLEEYHKELDFRCECYRETLGAIFHQPD